MRKLIYLDLDNTTKKKALEEVMKLKPIWYNLKKSSARSYHASVLTEVEGEPSNADYQKVITKRRKYTLRITRKVVL